ncbi:MAG: response regulator [Bdellovibrionales bacterium]|jgi:CheY-like chemotaxis protein|nr:response regulator [Bdellovibrionales bacterium]MBT3526253.1 response regulator [Bdellovibrionales bacterium]MBT7668504.1 response regulator [Bdellovibrionales bacterium]MBT7766689.1 response regulator [Bdellovibrionales bacterium]
MINDADGKYKEILVIGRHVKRASAISLELLSMGHAVQSAINVEHALSLLESVDFDCVIMEIHPQNIDGSIAVLHFIQSGGRSDRNRNLSIIGLGTQPDYNYSSIQRDYPIIYKIIPSTVDIKNLCQQVLKLPTRRVLVVDDDSEFHLLVKRELEAGGFAMSWAPDVEKAIELLETKQFMCMIMDIILGVNKTSQPLVQYLKQRTYHDLNFGLPVLVTSAHINNEQATSIMKNGTMIFGVVKKPSLSGEFVRSVNHIFNFYAYGWMDKLSPSFDDKIENQLPVVDQRVEAIHKLILNILDRGEDNYLDQIEIYLKKLQTVDLALGDLETDILPTTVDGEETDQIPEEADLLYGINDDKAERFEAQKAGAIYDSQINDTTINNILKKNTNVKNINGLTPLMIYCSQGNLDISRKLVKRGAQINKLNKSGQCCLHFAARSGNPELVAYLLDHNAAINRKDINRQEPIYKSVISRSVETVQLLISRGAKLNNLVEGRTLLMIAFEMNDDQIFKVLLDAGADTELIGSHDKTIHQLVKESKNKKMIKILAG